MNIEISRVNKLFGYGNVLTDVSLHVESGEIVALLGPSGSGKTTLLRIIAGLEDQNSGHIRFKGVDVNKLNIRDRKVGFVFQNYALFRHMTILENVSFGIRMLPRYKRPNKHIINKKAMQLLTIIQLDHLSNRYPGQLSGGQKQRVALARSLAIEPEILLLDEPFGALDTQVRKELRSWLQTLHQEFKFTGIFVTHDREEAMEIANRIVIMNKGIIEQIGTPKEIWDIPSTKFVLKFLSEVNCMYGLVYGSEVFLGPYHWTLSHKPVIQGNIELFCRPWEMDISREFSALCPLPAKIIRISLHGYYWKLTAEPLGWNSNLLTVIVGVTDVFGVPKNGDYCYLSGRKARLYAGETLL